MFGTYVRSTWITVVVMLTLAAHSQPAADKPQEPTGVDAAADPVTHEENDRVPEGAAWTQHYFSSSDGSGAELHADALLPEGLAEGHRETAIHISTHRNPLIHGALNPLVNDAINPLVNRSINPLINETRNPLMNDAINPLVNDSINPLMNKEVNYLVNESINPLVNGSINPSVNSSVNPLSNGTYPGPFLFTIQGTPAGFGVETDGGIVALFSETLNHDGTAIPAGDMLVIFDTGNRWVGYFVPNGSGGYARFDISGQWVGYAHKAQ